MLKTAVVMTNKFPWNDLVLNGYGEKSGSQNIRHRGIVLLRNSKSRVDRTAMDEHNFAATENLGYIIGAAELVEVVGDPGDYFYSFERVGRFTKPIEFNPRGPVRWARIPISAQIRRAVHRAGLGDLLG